MAEATIDIETQSVRRSLHIDATRERVWEAITRPEYIAQWFGDEARWDTFTVGGTGVFTWHDYGDFPVRIEEIDPPTTFAFRWGQPGAALAATDSTLARFTLDDDGDGTLLTVVETGFDRCTTRTLDDHRGGWNSELDELAALLS